MHLIGNYFQLLFVLSRIYAPSGVCILAWHPSIALARPITMKSPFVILTLFVFAANAQAALVDRIDANRAVVDVGVLDWEGFFPGQETVGMIVIARDKSAGCKHGVLFVDISQAAGQKTLADAKRAKDLGKLINVASKQDDAKKKLNPCVVTALTVTP